MLPFCRLQVDLNPQSVLAGLFKEEQTSEISCASCSFEFQGDRKFGKEADIEEIGEREVTFWAKFRSLVSSINRFST